MDKVEKVKKILATAELDCESHDDYCPCRPNFANADLLARQIVEALDEPQDLIEDGFGATAPAVCPKCGCRSMYVCRPGDIRCGVCYDGNPKEWYIGGRCNECGFNAVHNGVCLCCANEPPQTDSEGLLTDEELKRIDESVPDYKNDIDVWKAIAKAQLQADNDRWRKRVEEFVKNAEEICPHYGGRWTKRCCDKGCWEEIKSKLEEK